MVVPETVKAVPDRYLKFQSLAAMTTGKEA
jgi:hypothetical protein